ncbi:MAG: hypothetical protein FWD53_05880 [Phycisphaerales bacterium]|nr:hypothetical protein [Phycisphaerales bacterium]
MTHKLLITACSLLLFSTTALADSITKTNGQTLHGKIVEETPDLITLQSNLGELITRTRIARKDIAKIKRDAVADASYCRIPIEGTIGQDVTAHALEKSLELARSLGSNYVVLCIDSGGGEAGEMVKILEVLKNCTDMKLIAHVKRAGSAAALIAMTCPTIIVATDSSIGAAVPFKVGPDGTPENVEAKWLSFFESIARGAAQSGGHSPLLVRGMMDLELTLSLRTTPDGKPEVFEGSAPDATLIKKPGKILTLQGPESHACGLAAAIADDITRPPPILGIKSWSSVGDAPWSKMKNNPQAKNNPTPQQQKENHKQIDELKSQHSVAINKANTATDAMNKLTAQANQEANAATDEYRKARFASRRPSADKQAHEAYEAKMAAIRGKYDPLIATQKRIYSEAVATSEQLHAKILKLTIRP